MSYARLIARTLSGVAIASVAMAGAVALVAQGPGGRGNQGLPPPLELVQNNTMNNPFRMLENWPHLGDIKPGAAIGLIPDGKGIRIGSAKDGSLRYFIEGTRPEGLAADELGNVFAD